MIQKGHRSVKDFKIFLESLGYIRLPRNFHINLLNYYFNHSVTIDKLYLNEFLDKKDLEYLQKRNNKRLNIDSNNNVTIIHEKDRIVAAMDSIKDIIANSNKEVRETRSLEYTNLIEEGEDDNVFKIKKGMRLSDVWLNFFKNNDIVFKFNDILSNSRLKFDDYVQTVKLEITPTGGQIILPTKYTVQCTEKTKDFGECGNKVSFCSIHKNSKIKCTDNMAMGVDYGHTIKNISEAPVEESKKFFIYTAKDMNNTDEASPEYLVYSCENIEREIVTANCVYVNDPKQPYILLLCIDDQEKLNELDYDILQKNPDNYTFLDDIFESIKEYVKKEHGITITNQNRVVAKFMMFQLLSKIFFNTRFHSLIMGKSGAGKSFFSEVIIPFFTFKYVVTPGGSVSRNRFLGGQDKYKNAMPGMVVTQDVVFIEEGTDEINKFLDPKRFNKIDSFFNWVKVSTGREYDVGVQGTGKMYPKASLILVGNIDQLDILVSEYKSKVAKKYKLYTNGGFYKNSWPLFKSLEYYTFDPELMKAHAYVRKEQYKRLSYRTGLPEAEESRFSILIILEEDDQKSKLTKIPVKFDTSVKEKIIFHRKNFVKELKNIFINKKLIPQSFQDAVESYIYDDFFQKKNNFTEIPGMEINNHLKGSISSMIYLFIVMDKMYWGKDFVLLDDDKVKVEDFLRYNYNCLTSKEATGYGKKPLINDFSLVSDSLYSTTLNLQKSFAAKKKEEEKKENTKKETEEDLFS